MTLRRAQDQSKVRSAALAAAIHTRMDGRTNTWLAGRIGVSVGSVTRMLQGEIALGLERVGQIEDALKLPRGQLLVDAGFVADDALPAAASGTKKAGRGTKVNRPRPPAK